MHSEPDYGRLGGLHWTRRTGGALTPRERRTLLGAIVRAQAGYVAGRIRLASGRLPAGARDLATADLRPPDSRLAREAEAACAEQPAAVAGHGCRSWIFGSGLARLDRTAVDPELFYVACLLHDFGLAAPVAGEDFTLRSAERAERCVQAADAPAHAGESIGDAITVHTTPGISADHDGSLGFYVQAGALLDLVGIRAGDLPPAYREDAIRQHPRDGVAAEITRMVGAEARANPQGRFALLHRCGFNVLVKVNPLRPS